LTIWLDQIVPRSTEATRLAETALREQVSAS
jgi:hypothetical protein